MKTAISIPDGLFASADALAERLGVSRSQLYARAVAEFVAKHDQHAITAQLDQVYGAEPASLDPARRRAQAESLRKVEW